MAKPIDGGLTAFIHKIILGLEILGKYFYQLITSPYQSFIFWTIFFTLFSIIMMTHANNIVDTNCTP